MLLKVKQLIWILFILFDFCILAAVVGGVYYLESDGPRMELEKLLSEKLGREVVFEENLDLIFYPWLGLDTGSVTVAGASGADHPHQLSVKDIDFKVRLLPLLFGDLEVDTIVVDSPVFRLDRGKDGNLDLPFIGEGEEDGNDLPQTRIFKSISVRGMSVVNATCIYTDIGSGNSLRISGVNVRTGLLRKDTPLAFDLTALLDTDLFGLQAKTDVKGLIDFSRQKRTISLSDTSLSVIIKSSEILGTHDSIQGIANLNFDLVDGLIDVKGLVIQGAGMRLSGTATCKDIYHFPDFSGHLKSTRFDPKAVFSRFTPVPIPAEFKDILSTASFSVNFHSTLDKTELSNMVLAVDNTSIKGDFSLTDYKKPWVEFDVVADSIILDPYAKLWKLGERLSQGGGGNTARSSVAKKSTISSKGKDFRSMVIADLVHKIPCKGKVEVGRLVYEGMRLETTRLAISPGPGVASLSIAKGSYFDGDFSLKADLAFDKNKEKDTLYLFGKGAVSPFSLARLPAKIDGIKFRSGKAGLKLNTLASQGKTLGELVKNLKLNLELSGGSVAASLSSKDVPAKYRNFHTESLNLELSASPLAGNAPTGLVGREFDLNLSAHFLKPAINLGGNFKGEIFCSRKSPDLLALKNSKLDFSFGGKGVPTLEKDVKISLAGGGAFKDKSLKLDDFSIRSGKINLHGELDAKRLGTETATAFGRLKLGNTKCFEFFELFGVAKPETQDEKAFDSVELDTAFQLNGENLNLRVNRCRLDNATARGTFELVDFKNPTLNFIIDGDNVDVDRFLPPEEDHEVKRGRDKNTVSGSKEFDIKLPEWQFPDNLLGAINATGRVDCKTFRIFDFGGSKISADVDMQESVIDIHNLKAKFHGGNLAGKLDLGLRNGTVSLDTDLEARGFKAGLFFADYVGRDYVKGLADASLQLKGHSTANVDFDDTMTGRLAFKIIDGSYLFAASEIKDVKEKKAPSPTKFSIMQGTIDGKDGNFNVKDYLLKTDYLTATATGGFSFPKDSINLKINADIIKLPNLYLKIVNALLDAITGVNVTVSGNLYDPKVEVKGLERWSDVLGDVLGLPEQSFMFFRKLIF